jgi:phosphoribosyl-AMP cyclohydrolase
MRQQWDSDHERKDMPEQTDTSDPTGISKPTPGVDLAAAAAAFPQVKFDSKGLVPCVVQEWTTGEVLMLAYMNAESLRRTLETGTTWFHSRSRNEYWNKGATSGHFQKVRELRYDCDGDTLLALVEQSGAACHTGDFTCFDGRWLSSPTGDRPPFLSHREQ